MSGPEILGESLPFDERIELPSWTGERASIASYKEFHLKTVRDSASHWESLARELHWFRMWDSVVTTDGDHPHVYRWFEGGLLNLSYLALDSHIPSLRDKMALIWEGEPTDEQGGPREVRKLTYGELLREVNRFSHVLRNTFDMKKGDKIAIYMPLVPEAVV